MEETPAGTSVGVDDPYAHADVCDHVTGDATCRFAVEHAGLDPDFAAARREDGYVCPPAAEPDDTAWADCPHFRSRNPGTACARCGLEERRDGVDGGRPLLEEHHLSYADAGELHHEITVPLCRWCHAKVHSSWASLADDVEPDPEAIAAREQRRARELDEFEFRTAADRRDG